ncbi:hypothetical protein BKA93DRAFT_826309 [Sparassis latifolia]
MTSCPHHKDCGTPSIMHPEERTKAGECSTFGDTSNLQFTLPHAVECKRSAALLTFSSSSLHRPPRCDDAAPAPHSHTLLPPRSPILLRPPHSREEPTCGQPGNTAQLREVNGPALSPRPRTPLALRLSVLQPSRSREEPTRGQPGNTAWLREVDGPALSPRPCTPLALRPFLRPPRSRGQPTHERPGTVCCFPLL